MHMKAKQPVWGVAPLLVCFFMPTLALLGQDEQPAPSGNGPAAALRIKPSGWGSLTATERAPEQIDSFEATYSPPEPRPTPFHPTMSPAEYLMLKTFAGRQAQAMSRGSGVESPIPLHGIAGATAFTGGNQSDNGSVGQPAWFPPDSSGAVGSGQFVQTSNAYINVYSKIGVLLKHTSLASLMGFSTTAMFDPRVQYDDDWNRFVVTSDSFPVDSTHQFFWIAVSKTSNPTGAWSVYSVNTNGFTGTGSFWDFPSLGLQQDSIIITANVFGTSTFLGAYAFALAKAQAYNGFKQGFPVFKGLQATLQPPKVQKNDLNGFAWLAAAPPGAGAIYMYAMENPSSPNNTLLSGPYTVTGVGAYSVPPPASQTCGGGANALDTSDNRFVNASTQLGDKLYQVHSIGSPATIRYYVIKGLLTFKPAVAETGDFFSTLTSSDYNPSIAADASNNLAITWTETDASGAVNAAVRYVGRQTGDAAISGAKGASLIASAGCLTNNFDRNFGMQRWGDYSQVTVDPSAAKTFWLINEDILGDLGTSQWGNEIGKINF